MMIKLEGIKQFALNALNGGISEKTWGDVKIKFEKYENSFLCVVFRKQGFFIDWFRVDSITEFYQEAKNYDLSDFE